MNVDTKLVLDELAAQRNKMADDLAVARAHCKELQARCAALEVERAALCAKLDEATKAGEGA